MKLKTIKLSVILLLGLSFITFILVTVLGSKTVYIPRPAYDKTGFVAKDDEKREAIVLENANYKFSLSTEDTNFELLDKNTNQVWTSTPKHDSLLVPADARELFVLYYERKIEASKRVSINDESIKYGNFEFRTNNDSIEVLYQVGGKHFISMVDLPRQIGNEDFQNLIITPLEEKAKENSTIRRQLSFLKAQFNYVEADGIHYLKSLTSQDSLDIVYNLIFNESLYTEENYFLDAEKYGFETSVELPYFEFSIKYELTNNGFDVRLINDSILESETFPIAYIDILPFFGSGNINDTGYTVIPDGSGVFINHNNQKYSTVGYEKRVYGNDLSIGTGSDLRPQTSERLSYPMYGYNKNGYGFINVVLEGDSMSTLRAGFLTEVSGNVYNHKLPYAHYRYAIRERDAFVFQSSTNQQRVTSWTTAYNTQDFAMSYQFINKENSTYFDMAKQYQAHLVETYLLTKADASEKLHVTLLGGYLEKKYFLGIPYTSVEPLTTTSGIIDIKNEIQALGINDFSLTYSGFSNSGIKSTSYVKTHYDKNITSRKQLSNLIDTLKNENIDLFLEYAALYATTDQDLNIDKDVTQNIFSNEVYRFPYNEATQLVNKNKSIMYIQNTDTVNDVISNVIKTSNKLNATNVSFTDLGNQLASNLAKQNTLFRYDIIKSQQEMLERLDNQNVQLRNPNMYLALQANQILDLDMKGTLHAIVDYDIPFVPLVLNGYINYTGQSINMDDSKSVQWHMLKAIETGANIQFTFTKENTSKLIKTDYNYLISTYYAYWMNDLKNVYQVIDNLNISGKSITNHEVLNPQGSLVEVTYEGNLKIRINYETESYVVVS